MSITPDEISRIQRYEGDPKTHLAITHLYRDSTHGNVTIGYGHLIPSVASAQLLPFIFIKGGATAAATDISKEWNTIMAKPFGKNYSAAYYASSCNLMLQSVDITKLLNNDLAATEAQLLARFTGYTQFAQPAQAALIDMGFNLGVAGLVNGYPSLVAAVRKKDWTTAAKECNRPQENPSRNIEVKQLFLQAAKQQPLPKPTTPTGPGQPPPLPTTGHTGSTGTANTPTFIAAPHYESLARPISAAPPAATGAPGLPGTIYSYSYDCQGIVAIVAMQSNVTTAAITAITAIASDKKQ